ncbi:unnamed protein product [Parnassius apollo]|uniref:(apollo) hypothetical protein n=1 Tax=Parnassius apollo TaxID=110799 RepID=A0A8S3X5X9_PARAO|nr:unnamed protein product [Parnassius apollo]
MRKDFMGRSNNNVSNVSYEPEEVPIEEELKNYWTEIWKKDNEHNEQTSSIKEEENKAEAIELMDFTEVTK